MRCKRNKSWEDRITYLLWMLVILANGIKAQRSSEFSSRLTYDVKKFSTEVSLPYNHEVGMNLFTLITANDDSDDLLRLALDIEIPSELLNYGHFKAKLTHLETKSTLDFEVSPLLGLTKKLFSTSGSASDINQVLSTLVFSRDIRGEESKVFEVVYKVKSGGNSKLVDSFSQTVKLNLKLQIEMRRPDKSAITIFKGQRFIHDLLIITDNRELFPYLLVKPYPSSSQDKFYTLNCSNGVIWIEGLLPDDDKSPELDTRDPYRVSFAVRDSATGIDSESFTFYLQVEQTGLNQNQKIKLAILSLVLFCLILVLFTCILIVIRKDKKLQKDQVKKQIQEAALQENVLTKSIVEWNKEMTSTRDQSHKDSMLYNPYDKYSLKKNSNKSKLDKNYENIGSSLNTVSADRSNRLMDTVKSRNTEHLEKITGLNKAMFKQDTEIKNNSKLEFSKVEEMNENLSPNDKTIEFSGELSRIERVKQPGDEDNLASKREAEPRLEDIILKGL